MKITHGFFLLAVVVLAGCRSSPPHGETTGQRRVSFACANGETIEVRFAPGQGIAVLVRDGKEMELLQQQPSASGFLYSNGPNTVRGNGDQLSLEIGRMAPIKCKAL